MVDILKNCEKGALKAGEEFEKTKLEREKNKNSKKTKPLFLEAFPDWPAQFTNDAHPGTS